MQTELNQVPNPAEAMKYFQNKVSFSTGPIELDMLIKSHENNFTIVDVREAEDFAKEHVPGAINLPRENWDNPNGLSKEKTNIVYCYNQNCHLAAKACVVLAGKGYPVKEMDGGFEAWKESSLDIERDTVNRLKEAGEKLFRS